MKKEDAIKFLQQLYPKGGHCWLDEQRIEAIDMAVKALREEPVSEDFTKALAECIHKAQCSVVDPLAHAEVWKEELVKLAKCEEPVSEDLEEASKEWLRPQLDKSYTNYGEAKMMELTHFDGYAMLDAIEFGAKWQKEKDSILPKVWNREKWLESVVDEGGEFETKEEALAYIEQLKKRYLNYE